MSGTVIPLGGRPVCGACPDCLERTRGRLMPSPVTCHAVTAVTAAQLERHAKKFGPEGVEETATELGLRVKVERPRARVRVRAKGPTLLERVATHVAAGRNAEIIAELENLSPSRARRLIQEVS